MMIGRLYQSLDAIFKDLMREYDAAVKKREVTQESAAKLKRSMDNILEAATVIKTEHDELEKIQNTLQYLTAYAFEDTEVLASLASRSADIATIIGPGGKNLDWSSTFIMNMLLGVPEPVLGEAIKNIKQEDWQRITALRTKK